jgi:hypothetical protein
MLNGTWCAPTAPYHLLSGSLMLDNLEFDDSDSPAIGLVPPGVSWAQVRDHIKIAHHSLLVPPPADGGDFAGAYWTGTEMVVVDDLGPDQDQALDDFRATLQDLGET